MSKGKVLRNTDFITCPFCGYEDLDSWESQGEDGDIQLQPCLKCGKEFKFETLITVSFKSWKIEDENKPLYEKQRQVDDLIDKLE